jgi:hypothetical protein
MKVTEVTEWGLDPNKRSLDAAPTRLTPECLPENIATTDRGDKTDEASRFSTRQ